MSDKLTFEQRQKILRRIRRHPLLRTHLERMHAAGMTAEQMAADPLMVEKEYGCILISIFAGILAIGSIAEGLYYVVELIKDL